MTSNILFFLRGQLGSRPSRESWLELDPSYLSSAWGERGEIRPIVAWGAFFSCLGWFLILAPLIQTAFVLSRGGKRLVGPHLFMVSVAISATIIELLAHLMEVGLTGAEQLISKDFNLDNWTSQGDGTGWRVLELISITVRGMLLWIDAFESLALFGFMIVMHVSVSREGAEMGKGFTDSSSPRLHTFTKAFALYGLFVGLLCGLDFLAYALRFVNFLTFMRMARYMHIILGVVFFPIWLLCLAWQLPKATQRYEIDEKRSVMQLEEMTRFIENSETK